MSLKLTDYVVDGHRVLEADIVFTLTFNFSEPNGTIDYEAHQPRIHNYDAHRTRKLARANRGSTSPEDFGTFVFTCSNPPRQSRSHFAIGRGAYCDLTIDTPYVSYEHVMFGFEGEHVVMYDVSSVGCRLAFDDDEPRWTCPRPGKPYKCFLPPGSKIWLTLHGAKFQVHVPSRQGAELAAFREKRDAFLAGCPDLTAPTMPVRDYLPTETREWSAMYWFESHLDSGGFGMVFQARRLNDWAVFAAKKLQKNLIDNGYTLENEIRALQRLRHDRIVKYIDAYENHFDGYVLVMEQCQFGSLHNFLQAARVPFPPHITAEVLKQTAEGLVYLHGQRITHRDLKPANILVRQRNPLAIALSDFGLAKIMDANNSYMETDCGTWHYRAPEMLQVKQYTKAIDIWAFGVVGFELLERGLPRLNKIKPRGYPECIVKRVAALYHRWPESEKSLVAFVWRMLAQNPKDRPLAAQCVQEANELLISLTFPNQPIGLPELGLPGVVNGHRAQEAFASIRKLPPSFSEWKIRPDAIQTDEIEHYMLASGSLKRRIDYSTGESSPVAVGRKVHRLEGEMDTSQRRSTGSISGLDVMKIENM
ncbi:hypothetical protein N0V88_000481 [Collariella sp. IMI 366227]|nr:hypothetical protein N0V88_000481 [Collariella sp. IMI 366227]